MTNSTDFWTDLATTYRPDSAADDADAADEHGNGATPPLILAPAAPLDAPETAAPSPPAAGVALHPRMRLALDELLDAEQMQTTHNLAILIGRVRRVPARRRANTDTRSRRPNQSESTISRPNADATGPNPPPAPEGRYAITDYGIREDLYRLEIQEVAGDELDSAITSYSMDLAISHRLLESGLFEDGQRLAICGPLRMERSYDARFATSASDPGRPDWTTKLEVLSMLPVDETTPDGSFVELIGAVEGEPRIRREMVGAGAFESFATVRLRCRRQLRSGIGRSRAVFSTSTVLPLEVPLNGDLEHAGALLRPGNTVQIHGRLVQYRYQLPVRTSANTAGAARKGVQDVLDDIAATARSRLIQRQPQADDIALARAVRTAQQRFLTVIKPTIEVGYVELRHGTALSDKEIAELIAHWRPRPSSDRVAPRGEVAPPATDTVTNELDRATAVAFPADPAETVTPTPALGKPRRRSRAEGAPALDAEAGQDAVSDRDPDDAA